MNRSLLAACFCISVSTTSTAQIPTSIAALKLGMSSSQVQSALGPQFQDRLRKPQVFPGEAYPSVLVKNMNAQYSGTVNNESYSLEYIDDQLIYIEHVNSWVRDAPNFEQTSEDIVKKFGRPTTASNVPGIYEWNYSAQGQPVSDDQCKLDTIDTGVTGALATTAPRGARQGCGLVAFARVLRSNNSGPTVQALTVGILDEGALYRSIMQSQRRIQQQRQSESDRSRQNKAPL